MICELIRKIKLHTSSILKCVKDIFILIINNLNELNFSIVIIYLGQKLFNMIFTFDSGKKHNNINII